MENQNMEGQQMAQEGQQQDTQQNNQQSTQQQEKTFTQEEVNRIVQERLARAKNIPDMTGYEEREKTLNQREMRLNAREKLADAGLPKELLPLINCNSKEEMEISINLISTYFGGSKGTGPTYKMSTGAGNGCHSSEFTSEAEEADIRKAMGLKGR